VSLLRSGTIPWLLAHEMRLGFRALAGKRAMGGVGAIIGLSILALLMLTGGVIIGLAARRFDVPVIPLSAAVALACCATAFTLMLSQTLAAASEALYERGDLDLLFSSPIPPRTVLFVRALGVAAGVLTVFLIFVTPLLGPAVFLGHPEWLGLFGVLAALALLATATGLTLAMALFKLIGPRRTRTVAQVLAALTGAAFFLTSQIRTIMGEHASDSLFQSLARDAAEGRVRIPPIGYWPLKAMLGEPLPLLALLAIGAGAFVLSALSLGRRFADAAAATQGAEASAAKPVKGKDRAFASGVFAATLAKEIRLILRDAALLSQVLLRVLYLVPTALILSRTAGHGDGGAALAGGAGVVVFLAGQVAGSLSWITLSAEESPDLLAVSPAATRSLRRAKLAAALLPVALLLAVPLALLLWLAPVTALWTALGAGLSAWSCGLINVWHQKPGKRADFKRRRGASWFATLAEVVISALLAGATGLAVAGLAQWALIPLGFAGVAMLALRRSDEQIAKVLRMA
jgi:ABC-2 type transport system permease protein